MRVFIILIFSLALAAGDAIADECSEYCKINPESKNVVYFVDTQSFQESDDQVIHAIAAETILKEKIKKGDRVTLVRRGSGDGKTGRYEDVSLPHQCYPGMAAQSIIDDIIGKTCIKSRMMTHESQFKDAWRKVIKSKRYRGKIKPTEPYIRMLLKNLKEDLPDSKKDTILYIYSKMVIDSEVSEKSLDRHFVDLVIKDTIPAGILSEVNVFGIKDKSGPVLKFWKDYFEVAGAKSVSFSSQLR